MTKKELLAIAKEYQIIGRHEMTVVELQAAINEHEQEDQEDETREDLEDEENAEAAAEFQAQAEGLAVSKDALKNVTRRYPSLLKRDENNRVIRAGKNLSGNRPFRYKYYYLNPLLADESRWTPAYREAFEAAPKQVQGILRYMAENATDKRSPMLGGQIAGDAKALGFVESKIDNDKLFAYYRRALEVLGVIHAVGYDPENEEGSDEE